MAKGNFKLEMQMWLCIAFLLLFYVKEQLGCFVENSVFGPRKKENDMAQSCEGK